MDSPVLGFLAFRFSLTSLIKKVPNDLISTDFLIDKELEMLSKKVFNICRRIFLSKCLFFSLSFFNILDRDNYLSFFLVLFLPSAFSNIPLRVAPDLVAPSPNLATKLFSSSI